MAFLRWLNDNFNLLKNPYLKMKYSPTDISRQFLFVREAGQNKGQRVEAIQHWSGGIAGASWCAYFATMILDICFEGNAPIPRQGAVQGIYDLAKQKGWMVIDPQKDDIFIYVNDVDHAHHIGFITENGNGIAGNTSSDGKSSNGDGVYEHQISVGPHVKYIRYPK
jgi:hypothetical protein